MNYYISNTAQKNWEALGHSQNVRQRYKRIVSSLRYAFSLLAGSVLSYDWFLNSLRISLASWSTSVFY
jgi:hypothetical protein